MSDLFLPPVRLVPGALSYISSKQNASSDESREWFGHLAAGRVAPIALELELTDEQIARLVDDAREAIARNNAAKKSNNETRSP